ncbi:MAG: hypothetical protein JXL84_23130, partial [Deltaproteobacteria bacterium]|nr:hypothetical protein [Deltaproteobacteria bacterium]
MKNLILEDDSRLSICRKNAFAFLSLFLFVVLIYSNSFHASWHLDDGPNITENRRLHLEQLSWSEIKKTLLSTPASSRIEFFRPVSRFSLALNYYLGKTEVLGYHIVNVSIHIIASFFLYLFLHRLLNLPPLRKEYGPYSYFVALLATAFWTIHPIQTQAVTYVVQRMASLAGMFYIMAMYFYVRAEGSGCKRTRVTLL